MRYADNGCFHSVFVSKREVRDFARRWPCFGDVRPMRFQFEKRNGDLVDLSGDDGSSPEGVRALSEDAQNYAEKRHKRATNP